MVGPLPDLLDIAWFIAAMTHVPTTLAHLAVTNDPRALFEFPFIRVLVRLRPGYMAFYAALISIAMLPVSILRAAPTSFANIELTWESTTAEQVNQFANRYILACGVYLFLAFVVVQLISAWFHRSSVRSPLHREPRWADRFHPVLARTLQTLDLLRRPPAPLVAAVLGPDSSFKEGCFAWRFTDSSLLSLRKSTLSNSSTTSGFRAGSTNRWSTCQACSFSQASRADRRARRLRSG